MDLDDVSNSELKVDVVVCTKNNVRTIKPVLKRVFESIPVNRLIVIDGKSTDGTLDVVKDFGAEVYSDGGRGIGYARNMALKLVDTPIFAFIDADILIPRDWFRLIKYFDDPSVAVASGYYIVGLNDPILKYLSIYNFRKVNFKMISLSNVLARLEALVKVGGIREDLPSNEDFELHNRLTAHGFKWIVDKSVIAHNPRDFIEHLHHVRWWGMGARRVGRHQIKMAKFLFKAFTVSNLRLAFEIHPSLLLYYPVMRLYHYLGYLEEARKE